MNYKEVANYIVNWLNDYIKNLPLEGFIVGVSGGVDSAVVATLCAKTNKKVILLNLPILQQSSEFKRAEKQILKLENEFPNVKGMNIDLTSSFQEIVNQFPDDVQKDMLSLANVRSRLRMVTLYAIGQTNKCLVTGTGNKIEDFGIGFFTKYGDGGVDINPIGDLMKSEVYKLGEHIGVIDDILQAKPADGLWDDDRTDEDQIGATYDELEWAMSYDGSEKEKLTPRQLEVLNIYKQFNQLNQHKLQPIPFCDLSSIRK